MGPSSHGASRELQLASRRESFAQEGTPSYERGLYSPSTNLIRKAGPASLNVHMHVMKLGIPARDQH